MTPLLGPARFEDFYIATKDDVLRAVLVARGGSRTDSEDAVAEAYARAYLRWEAISVHPRPMAWVIRTAINHRISLWRRRRREQPAALDPRHDNSPDSIHPALMARLRALPPGQREVLALRLLLDFSTEQTAETLGVTPGTVKKQLHRALETMRKGLSTDDVKEFLA